jgi:hypothetical protein
MQKISLVLALSLICAGICSASEPVVSAGGGGMHVPPIDRYFCWLDTPNFEGAIMSSEEISQYELESEVANDFALVAADQIGGARWWGGYFSYTPGDPLVTSFNLRFYEDAGNCTPGELLYEWILLDNANETYVYDQAGFPIYEYDTEVCCTLSEGTYWFGA